MDYSEFDALPSKTDEISISEEPRALMIGARLHGGNAYVEP